MRNDNNDDMIDDRQETRSCEICVDQMIYTKSVSLKEEEKKNEKEILKSYNRREEFEFPAYR